MFEATSVAVNVPLSQDEDIRAAEAALFAARKLPAGPDRYKALVAAGKLRYDAHRRFMNPRQSISGL
jgi:hypothetical protein